MAFYPQEYDLIVVGAGHAGCEGALAAARMGLSVLMFNLNLDTMAQMATWSKRSTPWAGSWATWRT